MKFKKTIFKGFIFSALSSFIVRILTFGTTIILSRFLSPKEFGIVGQAILFINILMLFSDMGFAVTLIYQRGDLKKIVNTAFLIVLPLSFTLSLLGFLLSHEVALFFKAENYTAIYQLLSWVIFFSASSSVLSCILTREMKFEKLIYPEVFSSVIYAAIAIGLSLYGFGLWSLVVAYFLQSLINLVLLYIYCPWKLEFVFDKKLAYKMFLYGKEIVLTSFAVYWAFQGDNFFCGKFLSAQSLGFYTLAYSLSNLPVIAISQMIISKVALPMFSQLQNDKEKLNEAFLKIFLLNCFLVLPINLGIFALGRNLIVILFSSKWLPMLNVMQVLCFFAFLRSANCITGTFLNAVGKPYIVRNSVLVHIVVMASLIFPLGFKFGILGVGISALIAQTACLMVLMIIIQKIVNFDWFKLFSILFFCSVGSVLTAVSLNMMVRYLFIKATPINLLSIIILGIMVYLLLMFALRKKWFFEVMEIFQGFRKI